MASSSFEVAIVGAGPVGLTLANLLGVHGVRTVVLERNPGTVEEPRAIAIDAESLRTLQTAGLYEAVKDDMLLGFHVDYVNGRGQSLFDLDLDEAPYGHALQNSFDQPTLERQLHAGLERFEHVDIRFGHRIETLSQDDDVVRLGGQTDTGQPVAVDARYVVGCDGGRSTVRQQLGIEMNGTTAPQRWLVVDTVDPTLDDALACRFYCDPSRPAMTLKKRHGKRRWEWMLLPDEHEGAFLEDARIHSLLAPHTDTERVTIERKCVYTFHSIVADRYRDGRVLIAGDAAHMMPPFAGQGMNGGIRDARNLAWKLALVLRELAGDGLLDTYEVERRDHVIAATRLANQLGSFIQPTSRTRAFLRDAFFLAARTLPFVRRSLEGMFAASLRAPRLPPGTFVAPESPSAAPGAMLPQPDVTLPDGRVARLDEILGPSFAIVGIDADPAAALPAASRAAWDRLGARHVHLASASGTVPPAAARDHDDHLTRWLGGLHAPFLVVRPDKFVVAQFSADGATAATRDAIALLGTD